MAEKTTFAILPANRGFFPGELMEEAREELPKVLKGLGHDSIMMDAELTRHGAIETPKEGRLFANFLRENEGKYGGIILTAPNFGDETGVIAALKDARVPIFIHAWPDELTKMRPEVRRDSFCGKFSIMDVFMQNDMKFVNRPPHVDSINSDTFQSNIEYFDRLCRVVNGMQNAVIGAIGARTTAFKTVRIDEVALQRKGITIETFDLLGVYMQMQEVDPENAEYKVKASRLINYANWESVPDTGVLDRLVRLGVVIDRMVVENGLNAVAIRCWEEMQRYLNISPCILLSEMNDRGIPAACEVDIGNAVMMLALNLASDGAPACLDWNNNYGDDPDKCILFHCGPVPASLMTGPGTISDHAILANAVGAGKGFGCNVGRIKPHEFTFGSVLTMDGNVRAYLGEGEFTGDKVPDDFFGCAGVAFIENLQQALINIGKRGHRHHTSVAPGYVMAPVGEALSKYCGFDVEYPQYPTDMMALAGLLDNPE